MANEKSFSLEFTDGKHYDLDKIIYDKDRSNFKKELVMKVDEDSDRDLEYPDGQLVMSKEQDKIAVTRDDIRRYFFTKRTTK